MAITRIDADTVRIKHKNGYYYLHDIPEGNNIAVVEKAFLRGFKEGSNGKG